MPSAVLKSAQTSSQVAPEAITPGISVTLAARSPGSSCCAQAGPEPAPSSMPTAAAMAANVDFMCVDPCVGDLGAHQGRVQHRLLGAVGVLHQLALVVEHHRGALRGV